MKDIQIGDRIRFKAITRWGDRTAWRKVIGFDAKDRPLVRFGGWSTFIVLRHEVTEVERFGEKVS